MRSIVVTALIIFLSCSPCFALFGDKRIGQAKQMWKEGRYTESALLLRKTCADSNNKAYRTLLKLMKKLPDVVRAELETKCNERDADACADLGWYYWATHNISLGAECYHKACEYGDSLSCHIIGVAYYHGLLRRDCIKAKGFFERACSKNIGDACAKLGWLYKYGCGEIKKNKQLSRKYLEKGCKLHNKQACKELRPLWRKVLGF